MKSSELIVLHFEDLYKADEVLLTLAKMQQEHLVSLEDAAVVVKTDKGKVKIRQTLDLTPGKGAVNGGFWGLLIGLLLFNPLVGWVSGLAFGALWGRMVDLGVSDAFMKEVGEAIEPETSAIFMLVRDATYDKVIDQLRPFGGTLYHTSMPQEAEEELRAALEREAVPA